MGAERGAPASRGRCRTICPSAGLFYNSDVIKYDYDLAKAKSILNEAGFIDRDGDGILEDMEGNKVQFNLITNAGSTERVQIASIIRRLPAEGAV